MSMINLNSSVLTNKISPLDNCKDSLSSSCHKNSHHSKHDQITKSDIGANLGEKNFLLERCNTHITTILKEEEEEQNCDNQI